MHEVIVASISNVVSSVALVLANKRAVIKDGFDFMIVLTGLHFYASFLCCFCALLWGTLQYKMVKSYISLLRIAALSLMSIVFMNLNLKYNSVGFYQISKLCCIPVSLLLETLFGLRKQKLTKELLSSLGFILVGMYLVIDAQITYDNQKGLLYMALGVLCTSIAQIWFAPLQRELGLNSMQLLFHTSPWMAFSAFLITPLCEDTPRLLEYKLTGPIVADLSLSCLMAFGLNLSNYKVLELTSPLTYQVLGHFKTVAILVAGMLLFDDELTKRVMLGVALSVVGMVVYGIESNRDKATAAAAVARGMHDGRGGRRSIYADGSNSNGKRKSLHAPGHKGRGVSLDLSQVPPVAVPSRPTSPSFTSAFGAAFGTGSTPTSSGESGSASPSSPTVQFSSETKPGSASAESTVVSEAKTAKKTDQVMQKFNEAVTKIGASKEAKPTNAQKLLMYGYFKFVQQGACTTQRPGWTDPVGQSKWDAWKNVDADSTKDDVCRLYIELVDGLLAPKK